MEQNKKSRTLVVGDIHGNYKGLLQALSRSNFNNDIDTLISLGDVVDGHTDSFEVVETLLGIKNLIAIKGNHDDWFNQWIEKGINPANWGQGQKATGLSYLKHSRPEAEWYTHNEYGTNWTIKTNDIPDRHIQFFANQLPFYLDKDNNLFIHGGFNRHFHLGDQDQSIFWWDRDLWSQALSYRAMVGHSTPDGEVYKPKFNMIGNFKEVFIGHTMVQFWEEDTPMHAANIWNLDTGAGWYGKVTIMDVETKEFWQSDKALELYPDYKGRG